MLMAARLALTACRPSTAITTPRSKEEKKGEEKNKNNKNKKKKMGKQ